MKPAIFYVLLSTAALAQNLPEAKVITFSRADTEHCRVIVAAGKPLLESSYGGTRVAIGMPENKGNGEFAVYVSISRSDNGTAHVVPKDFSAVYSDPAHSRLYFFDKAGEVEAYTAAQSSSSVTSATSNEIDRSMIRGGPPGPGAAGLSPSDTLKGDDAPGVPNAAQRGHMAATTPVFLKSTKVKQGATTAGYVYLRKPKGSKAEVTPRGTLDEIDIPVDGVTFRF